MTAPSASLASSSLLRQSLVPRPPSYLDFDFASLLAISRPTRKII